MTAGTLAPQIEPLLTANPVCPFMVDAPALALKQDMDPPIFLNIISQFFCLLQWIAAKELDNLRNLGQGGLELFVWLDANWAHIRDTVDMPAVCKRRLKGN
jgi:hypothetical protein